MPRFQYQIKAEARKPEVIVPFIQETPPPRRPAALNEQQLTLAFLPFLPPLSWATETTLVVQDPTIQYQQQARVDFSIPAHVELQEPEPQSPPKLHNVGGETIVELRIPPHIELQEPEPQPPPRLLNIGGETRVEVRIPSFDWWRQPVQLYLPARRVYEGDFALGAVPAIPSLTAWFRQTADFFLQRMGQAGGGALVVIVAPTAAPSFGWFRQQADLFRQLRLLSEGAFALGEPPIVSMAWAVESVMALRGITTQYQARAVPPFQAPAPAGMAWYRQGFDFFPPRPRVEGGYARPEPRFLSHAWYKQGINVFPPRPRAAEGAYTLGRPIFLSHAWFRQQQAPTPKARRADGFFSLVQFQAPSVDFVSIMPQLPGTRRREPEEGGEVLPPFLQVPTAWRATYPDLLLPLRRATEGGVALPPFPQVPVGWKAVYPDLLVPAPRKPLEPQATAPPQIEVITADKWFRQSRDPFYPDLRQYPEPALVIVPPGVFADSWLRQHPEYFPARYWMLGGFAQPILPIGTAFPDFVFEALECLDLWDIDLNALMPGPSGWKIFIETFVASGFVYIAEEDCLVTPGGLIVPLPPSGWEQRQTNEPWDMSNT